MEKGKLRDSRVYPWTEWLIIITVFRHSSTSMSKDHWRVLCLSEVPRDYYRTGLVHFGNPTTEERNDEKIDDYPPLYLTSADWFLHILWALSMPWFLPAKRLLWWIQMSNKSIPRERMKRRVTTTSVCWIPTNIKDGPFGAKWGCQQPYTSDAVHSGYCRGILWERRSFSRLNLQDVLNGALGEHTVGFIIWYLLMSLDVGRLMTMELNEESRHHFLKFFFRTSGVEPVEMVYANIFSDISYILSNFRMES